MVESPQQQQRLSNVFHALADPTRRSILRRLGSGEKTVGEIAGTYPISLAAVSKHLKVLEAAQLTSGTRRGAFHVVRLQPETLRAASTWLAFYERFWTENLDQLQTYLEGDQHANTDPGPSRRKRR